MGAIQEAVASGELRPSDVRPQLLDSCLHTPPGCPAIDLVIRTSGETRLSDFMLWQVRMSPAVNRRRLGCRTSCCGR